MDHKSEHEMGHGDSSRFFSIFRLLFGVIWAIDAIFKWSPAFLNGLSDMLNSMVQGQPAIVANWLNLWIRIVGMNPHLFAILIALIESAIAAALILDVFPRMTLISGFFFSLLIWSVGEGFGGPYVVGSTDIGTGIIYALVFALMYFERFGKNWSGKKVKMQDSKNIGNLRDVQESKKNLAIKSLSLAVIILLAFLLGPYFVVRMNNEPSPGMDMSGANGSSTTTMSPDMMMKTFELAGTVATSSVPTVNFDLIKDTLDGWDIHIVTTNFTFTPQSINQAPVADQGHVHLYIDGVLHVVFGSWYHIDSTLLPPGKHIVTVSLNANDHSIFSYKGKYIEATQTLYVSPI